MTCQARPIYPPHILFVQRLLCQRLCTLHQFAVLPDGLLPAALRAGCVKVEDLLHAALASQALCFLITTGRKLPATCRASKVEYSRVLQTYNFDTIYKGPAAIQSSRSVNAHWQRLAGTQLSSLPDIRPTSA